VCVYVDVVAIRLSAEGVISDREESISLRLAEWQKEAGKHHHPSLRMYSHVISSHSFVPARKKTTSLKP
jgi:hypothetical protein